MTPADWTALAERIEALDGPSREVDADVWDAFGLAPPCTARTIGKRSPAYTASLDATLSLVPGGWQFILQTHDGRAAAFVWFERDGAHIQKGIARTPALALLAAICRAMAEAG